jgi:hypothetical protein
VDQVSPHPKKIREREREREEIFSASGTALSQEVPRVK